ncbi:hypothetical protein GYMLUDRAFT_877428 [Collybiopsis luxurians FD-317 M1]|nr:hypothetical protein GYMLUDRAFT_877428 [Collybiopsis luxurians FD-317 M1]
MIDSSDYLYHPDSTPTIRQGPSFFFVARPDANFAGGNCSPFGVLDKCVQFPEDFNNTITSVASTFAGVACTLFVNDDCSGGSFIVENLEEFPDLDESNLDLDNALSSYRCSVL